MTSYYLSYNESGQRRFQPPRWLLWLLLALLLIIIAIILALLASNLFASGAEDVSSAPAEPVPFAEAIPSVYAANTNTLYLVDMSGSITELGYLQEVTAALSSLALPEAGPTLENSRASLVTFGTGGEITTIIPFASLRESKAQENWLSVVNSLNGLQTTFGSASFIYDAVDSSRQHISGLPEDGREKVIVIISDGIDGAIGNCEPIPEGYQSNPADFCIGERGDAQPCGENSANFNMICDIIPSSVEPIPLMQNLINEDFVIHAVAYGSPDHHLWMERTAEATGGTYTVSSNN